MPAQPDDRVAPARRDADLVARPVGDELLLLDTRIDVAHSLPALTAAVWPLLDGRRTVGEIAGTLGVGIDDVEATLVQLAEIDAVDLPAGPGRRAFLRRGAVLGAALAALPAVQSVLAPDAAAAFSHACGTLTVGLTGCQFFGPPYNVNGSNNYTATLAGFGTNVTGTAYTVVITPTSRNAAGNIPGPVSPGLGGFSSAGGGTVTGTIGATTLLHADAGGTYTATVTYLYRGVLISCPYSGVFSC